MDAKRDIEKVERRAFAARKTMAEVCREAGLFPQAWTRVKSTGRCSVKTLQKMEDALDRIEAARR